MGLLRKPFDELHKKRSFKIPYCMLFSVLEREIVVGEQVAALLLNAFDNFRSKHSFPRPGYNFRNRRLVILVNMAGRLTYHSRTTKGVIPDHVAMC